MNEQIKKLAGWAGLTNTLGCFWQCGDHSLELFAELVANECAQLAKNKSMAIVGKAEQFAADEYEMDCAKSVAWQVGVLAKDIENIFKGEK